MQLLTVTNSSYYNVVETVIFLPKQCSFLLYFDTICNNFKFQIIFLIIHICMINALLISAISHVNDY